MAISKIVRLGLEEMVLKGRENGDDLNAHLATLGLPDRVSLASLTRYLASLAPAAAPAMHQPQIAPRMAEVALNVGGRAEQALATLDEYLTIAQGELDQNGQHNHAAIIGYIAESRKQVKLFVDLMDKLYSAQRIAIFQQTVLDAIEEADPEAAAKIRENLRRHHEIRRASLLGA